jgi:MORN repeat
VTCGPAAWRGLSCGLALITAVSLSVAAEPCKVLDPELQGSYEGGCRDGLAHGEGIARGSTAVYEGEFKRGLKHGRGSKHWAWGDSYEGEFRNDKKEGLGVYTWGRGSRWAGERYEGPFVDDKRQGWGVYTWPNNDRYEGPWEQDRRLGVSVMEWRRKQAHAAQREALRPGIKVCWLGTSPEPGAGAPWGAVEGFEEGVLKVRLSGSQGGRADVVARLKGQVISGAAENWAPCT